MLRNAGKKIVLLSTILLYAGIAASLAAGLFMIWNGTHTGVIRVAYYRGGYLTQMAAADGGRTVAAGFLVIVFGSLGAWLTALLLRAFGELSTDTRAIREQLECARFEAEQTEDEPVAPQPDTQAKADEPAQPKGDEPAQASASEPQPPKADEPAQTKPKPRKPAKPKPEAAADQSEEPAAR